jgi:hypothetical protein
MLTFDEIRERAKRFSTLEEKFNYIAREAVRPCHNSAIPPHISFAHYEICKQHAHALLLNAGIAFGSPQWNAITGHDANKSKK